MSLKERVSGTRGTVPINKLIFTSGTRVVLSKRLFEEEPMFDKDEQSAWESLPTYLKQKLRSEDSTATVLTNYKDCVSFKIAGTGSTFYMLYLRKDRVKRYAVIK